MANILDMLPFNVKNPDCALLFACYILWFVVYAFTISILGLNHISLLTPCIIYVILKYLTLPSFDSSAVSDVLGQDPRNHLRLQSDAFISNIHGDGRSDHNINVYRTIAHQAAGLDFVRNTLTAIEMCAKNGCKVVHINARWTADDIPVVYGDEGIYQKLSDGAYDVREIEDLNFEDIKRMDIAATRFEEQRNKEKISKLEEAILLCIRLNMHVIIDLARWDFSYIGQFFAMVTTILNLFKKYPQLYQTAAISYVSPFLLYVIRHHDPKIIVLLKYSPVLEYVSPTTSSVSWLNDAAKCSVNQFRKIVGEAFDAVNFWLIYNISIKVLNIPCVILHKSIVTPSIVRDLESKNVRVIVFPVNLTAEKQYYMDGLGLAYLTDTLSNPRS